MAAERTKVADEHEQLKNHMKKYEGYRSALKETFHSLVLAAGCSIDFITDNRGDILAIEPIQKIEPRRSTETKEFVLLHDVDRIKQHTWMKHKGVTGEESLMVLMKKTMEEGSKQECKFQSSLAAILTPLTKFLYHSGYDKLKESSEELCKKALDLEKASLTDMKKNDAFNKVHSNYLALRDKIMHLIVPGEGRPFDVEQNSHVDAIGKYINALKDHNAAMSNVSLPLKKIERMRDTKDKEDAKKLRIAKEEALRRTLQQREM